MNNISAIVSEDGEVISMSDFASEKEFQYKVLNNLDFETIKDFFIKKTIIDAVREKHKTSKGSNGVTTVEISNLFKWKNLEEYVDELESKKIIAKKQGINLEMFFVPK
jgi:hypothetical protein